MNTSKLTDELRSLLAEGVFEKVEAADTPEEQPDLATLSMWLRMALGEDVAPVGAKHKWADGRTYVKQRDGSWTPEPSKGQSGRQILALPAGTPQKKPTGSFAAVAKAKATAVKATPDSLPDDPFKYFHKTPDAKLIPLSALKTIRARPEGIKNAAVHMAKAFNGEGDKRKPVSLKDNGDGTYTVIDGNSTTAMARQHNWKNIVATVEPPDEKKEPKGEPSDAEILDMVAEKGLSFRDAVKNGVDVKDPKTGKVENHKLAAGVSAEEHVKIAKEFLDRHEKAREASEKKLKSLMPEGAEVPPGRTKKVKSALGKLLRKPKKYKKVSDLQDATGMRVIVSNTGELEKAIESLKKNYKIIESDDYVSAPQGAGKPDCLGYRSFHAIIEEDGLQKEIQLRTRNQHTHAEWCHDIYKPQSPKQEEGMVKHADTIAQYAREIGDHLYAVDSKKPSEKPPCPEPVRQFFSCL